MNITITGLPELQKKLDASQKAIAFGATRAISDTLFGLQSEMKKEIKDSFDRPTPYVINSVRYKMNPSNVSGTLYIKNEGPGKGAASPAEILAPHIFGGGRFIKKSEALLRRKGMMGQGQFIVPGPQAPLDQYGNISGPQMVKILSAAGVFDESGYTMNRTRNSKRKKSNLGKAYIIPFIGIFWRVTDKTSYPVLFFTYREPQYAAGRFDFYYIAKNYIKNNLGPNLKRAIARALLK